MVTQIDSQASTTKYTNHTNIKTPILLIGFNRPDTIKQAFDKIREVQPVKLYVAVDGPRHSKAGEAELVKDVRHIVQQVDWPCDAKYLFQEKNLGCKLGVVGAISWVLKNEDRVIIIEDDIIAVASFFYFAEELLEKYKDNERIAMISANNYTPIDSGVRDYWFSKYGHIWGWATWKRVWDKFDVDLPDLKRDLENKSLRTLSLPINEMRYIEKYAKNILFLIESNKINTWDSQFSYYRIRNNLLSIVPRVNLASNIGTTSSRTDTMTTINTNYYNADNDFNLLRHRDKIGCDLEYDNYHFKKHLSHKKTLIRRIINKALRTIKFKQND